MSRTAFQEHYGDSQFASISADYRLRAPTGPGGCRLYRISATVGGLTVFLPDARRLKKLGQACYTVINRGANAFTVHDADDALLTTVGPGNAVDIYIINNLTAAGEWDADDYSITAGATLLMDRQVVNLAYGNESRSNIDLLADAAEMGYDITVPSALQVYIVDEAVIGSTSALKPALNTSVWPTGTTLRLYVGGGARVSGKGGAGGYGGNYNGSLLPANGADGGPALQLYIDTLLINYGKIQGGGGGGGGRVGVLGGGPGGGGGGGAGHKAALGGVGGALVTGQVFTAGNGRQGTLDAPGAGGINIQLQFAGSGGNAGQSGGGGGSIALGGAGGYSIMKKTGITLTKLVAGTIDGSEVFF